MILRAIKYKIKKKFQDNSVSSSSLGLNFIGLDKITAKTSEIIVNLGETKKIWAFGNSKY